MRGMPFNLQVQGAVEVVAATAEENIFWRSSSGKKEGVEPRSVLDNRRSPSPPTSTSTLSSSLGGGGCGGGGGSTDSAGVVAVSNNPAQKWPFFQYTTSLEEGGSGGLREEWGPELPPISGVSEIGIVGGEKCGLGMEDLETMLSVTAAASPGQEQSFLRWIMGEAADDPSSVGGGEGFELVDQVFGFQPIGAIGGGITGSRGDLSLPVSNGRFPLMGSNNGNGNRILPPYPQSPALFPVGSKAPVLGNNPNPNPYPNPNPPLCWPPAGGFYEEEKGQHLSPNLVLNQQRGPQNPAFFLPLTSYLQPEEQQQPKRHQDLFFRQHNQPSFGNFNALLPHDPNSPQRVMKPKLAGDEALVDQLFKAAELVEAGNSVNAREILARLNHQLSPMGKPLFRASFYFKEALLRITNTPPSFYLPTALASPLDILLKLSAYKAFSEISPVLQFTNFTCIQALLEEFNACDRIHIIDFDIGVGELWSSFMQELAQRPTPPSLKITAFVSPSSHHPLELGLAQESLSHFARDLNIPFEFNVLRLDSFNPEGLLNNNMSSGCDEAIAVNFPVGSSCPSSAPALLCLVKQLSPKIVISVDHGCDRSDLSFSHHFLRAFQFCTVLLDSIDAAGITPEVAQKIERYLVQPRIENSMLGRHQAGEKMLPWRNLFASAGFVPLAFSNFTEAQADCLLKKIQVRGFHVEKRLASLLLCWQRGELVTVSAWRS